MNFFKNYLTQPSTYQGLLKIAISAGMLSTGLGGAIGAAITAVAGLYDVIRNERK